MGPSTRRHSYWSVSNRDLARCHLRFRVRGLRYRGNAPLASLDEQMVAPLHRKLLCILGWHRVEKVGESAIFGDLLRCTYCGSEDFEQDWVKVWWSKK
jgi:hypothetical protein